jgi:multiple sugar transport system ATP-binding protein
MHPGHEGMRLRADVIEPLGAHTLVTEVQAHGVFRAALPSDLSIVARQVLNLQPDVSRIRWYDADGRLVIF